LEEEEEAAEAEEGTLMPALLLLRQPPPPSLGRRTATSSCSTSGYAMLVINSTRLGVQHRILIRALLFFLYALQGMSCGGCASKVKRILESQVRRLILL
jgi:hypothetical protein